MIRLIGLQAHSEFRLSQLFTRLQQALPELIQLNTHYEFFLQTKEDLSADELALLKKVLDANEITQESTTNLECWVVPRFGTQSAWGSKARDILYHVGLTKIQRIERATVFQLTFSNQEFLSQKEEASIFAQIHDRMTETVTTTVDAISALFIQHPPSPLLEIPLIEQGKIALSEANEKMGLALSADEIDYLENQYRQINRNPTDVELMMFAQANSEHCRHKIFKAHWEIDGEKKADSLFAMIKNTYEHNSNGVLSAYKDNAAVVEGFGQQRFFCDPNDHIYKMQAQDVHLVLKVETHNHPTAIEPFAGAGTGQGGEIRDEGATGTGAKPKAGLTGFTVSNLHIPQLPQPWEGTAHYPSRIATSLDIMLKGPIGGAAFNNEFGRPNLCGYFRSFEEPLPSDITYAARGYHKPIMLAGGMGNISALDVQKKSIDEGALIIVLGGPALRIGLGGGAASSMTAGASSETLDFASVQRQNPEMERRCQEVIDKCWALGKENPILSIHDVGAGGLANAIPELVHDSQMGALLDLRKIPSAEKNMSPLEIWCNESQERYVLAINVSLLDKFKIIADRERCPYAVLGEATTNPQLVLTDAVFNNQPINIPQSLLFGNPPQVYKKVTTTQQPNTKVLTDKISLPEAISRVLQCPTVADKTFLITIGDRTVGGLVARDQMVGPWQIPVADCAVTATNYVDFTGEAMSLGERPPIALTNPAASAKMAVAEAVLNILAADVQKLSDIRLSCNWMAAANDPAEDADLFAAVEAVGKYLCPLWNITIPVGKDSLSMRTKWNDDKGSYDVISPVTLVASAFAPIKDIRRTLTPELNTQLKTSLLFIDLAKNQKRLGGSVFTQVTNQIGVPTPDVDYPELMIKFVETLQQLKNKDYILAYHDRSDGGLWVTLCEMAFASHSGLTIDLSSYVTSWEQEGIAALFNEESGVVIQVKTIDLEDITALCTQNGLLTHKIAMLNSIDKIEIVYKNQSYFSEYRKELQAMWSKTSFMLQSLRDNPDMAKMAYDKISQDDSGLIVKNNTLSLPSPTIIKGVKPKVAILREQGVNGHLEMAAAFTLAGFDAEDITMSDLLAGKSLMSFHGLAACGGFSYGDVLGAGKGWAKTILYQPRLREEFSQFFERNDTFTLGVCNGCQMLSSIQEIIPGSKGWPTFINNISEQFEARLSQVEICQSPSIFLEGMAGWVLPIAVSHGEGRAIFAQEEGWNDALQRSLVTLRYVDNQSKATESYPNNPNGSPQGVTGFTTADGRVTIMMPHPERVFKAWQLSWHPKEWIEDSPWMSLFINARNWLK